ncbi:MAG: hypothetical protein KGO52_08645 [Nitrospirota bacterium]|nr:hypothetical protein [Nitrospirota bacterium]MDE3118381.1 hypothetical protein [Nitrospirota bacterium]MDE3225082.1 hypothetical protein [Nitrospirota bacterium]MDE3242769.1 hypothetical protein [Nitrospirota bacterium]
MSQDHRAAGSSSTVRIVHYAVVGLLIVGGLAYWAMKPPTANPMADPRAAEAMALVQTHRAKEAPTLRQALTDRVQAMQARGKGVRMGEWTVEKKRDDLYVVKVFVREEGSQGGGLRWFERDYEWQVDLAKQSVVPMSMPAEDLMPPGMAGPLLRGGGPAGL